MLPMEPPSDEDREIIDKLEEIGRKLGLHLTGAAVHGHPHEEEQEEETDDDSEKILVGVFSISSGAFSKRVLYPEEREIDTEFRSMAINAERDNFIDIREKIRKRLAEGKDPFLGDDE